MRLGLFTAALLAAASTLLASSSEAAPIVAKGNKFFNSATGEEFRIKGMAYYPRPNSGKMANVGNYDWVTDEYEHIWAPHLEIMKDLGVNTIRLYSVDPSKSHDKFMCACAEAGIYVLVGMTAPCENCSVIDLKPPACYPSSLFSRIQMVYNAMAVYENTLGFSVGNENNLQITHGKSGTATAPCVKALLRDAREYAASCASKTLRQVPIGLDIADIPPRDQWIQYYDCEIDGNENTRADWLGFNPYVECNPLEHTTYDKSVGLQSLMKVYETVGYSRPLMFGEFGCNEGENTIDGFENQRGFYDAKWMNDEDDMTEQIVGGNVFEFTTEIANLVKSKTINKLKDAGKFGVGYFMPENCDHDTIECIFTPYPEYKNLKKAFTTTKKSTLQMDAYTPTRSSKALACPASIVNKLPPTPKVKMLECSVIQPVCSNSTSTWKPKPRSTKESAKVTGSTTGKQNEDEDETQASRAEAGSAAPTTSSEGTSSRVVASAVVVFSVGLLAIVA